MALITESKLRAMLKHGIPNPFPLQEGDKITPAAIDFLRDRNIKIPNKASTLQNRSHAVKHEQDLRIPIGVSNRHIHLSQEDIQILFGPDYELTPFRELSQPGQFAAAEQLTILGPKGMIRDVRILGPARPETQVEISISDGFQLGVHPPLRLSGSIENTPGITLIGPVGVVALQKGVIVAIRHVHMSPDNAKLFGVQDGDELMVQTAGERPVIFPDVVVRISPEFKLDLHVDLDEGNSAGLKTGDEAKVIGKNGKLFGQGGEEDRHSRNGQIGRIGSS